MSKILKKIICKCVISILLITTSFIYISSNFSVISFAETTEVVETTEDIRTDSQLKLLMYDIYNSSIYDKQPSLVDSVFETIYTTGKELCNFVTGNWGEMIDNMRGYIADGLPLNPLEISDLSEKITNKTVDIFDKKYTYIQSSANLKKNDCVTVSIPSGKRFCSAFSSDEPVYTDNIKNINRVYSNIVWTFLADEDSSLYTFYDKSSILKGQILTIKPSVVASSWDNGDHTSSFYIRYYIDGKYVGDVRNRVIFRSWSYMDDPYSISFNIPFKCSAVYNDFRDVEVPEEIDLDYLKQNNDVSNRSYIIGKDSFNFINSVDDNGQINGIDVLDSDGNLTKEIINYYYNYNDSNFIDSKDLPDNYQITFNNKEITDPGDVDVVVPGDDGNFLTWIASILDNIVNFFKYCYEAMREIFISAKGIVEYVSLVFEILPPPLPSLMKLALIILLLVSVVGFIRG